MSAERKSSPGEQALRLFARVHDTLYQRTGGRIGHRIPGAPNSLLLHTVGAKRRTKAIRGDGGHGRGW